jgi:DNA-binding response OmpR family regulator
VANGQKKRLLVVDDEKPIRHLLARIAQRAGFEVDTANDGVEALEMIAKNHYAIAIVDLMMPRLSGYELLQKISTLNPRPVVLVATAMSNGDVASLDDSMVRSVIKKPFDIDAVAKALIETASQLAANEEVKIPIASPSAEPAPVPEVHADGEDAPAVEEPPVDGER